jgi:hypothetical protein
MRRLPVLSLLALLATGCALRPRYADFVSEATPGPQSLFVLTDEAGQPLPGVTVELSELRNRVVVTTAADGTFALPVDKRYLKENPVLVVRLPAGVMGYTVSLAPPPAPPPAPEPSPAASTPVQG